MTISLGEIIKVKWALRRTSVGGCNGAQARLRGTTPCPRSGGCVGTEGPRGATPRSRSGGMAVRRYPSSKEGAVAVLC